MKRFLLTAAGGADPYTMSITNDGNINYNDGSILAILRKMKKDNIAITDVYIYLSLEMAIREKRKQVFTKSIKSIYDGKDINIKFFPEGIEDEVENLTKEISEEILNKCKEEETLTQIDSYKKRGEDYNEEKIRKSISEERIILKLIKNKAEIGIVEANKFGAFYSGYYKMIEDIKKVQDEDEKELYINISSGTPAMEMDLNLIAITSKEVKPKIIQVSGPSGSSNERTNNIVITASGEELSNLEIAELNNTNIRERVSFEEMEETRKLILLESLKDSFKKFDYAGVHDAIVENKKILKNPLIKQYADNLFYRYIGEDEKARNVKELELNELYPIFDDDNKKLVGSREILKIRNLLERINIMKVKAERNEINDWLLIAQTTIEALYKKLVYITCRNLDLDKIVEKNNKVSLEKFDKINANHIYDCLRETVFNANGNYVNAYLTKNILFSWWKKNNNNKYLKDDIVVLDKIRDFRNTAAHTDEFVTKEKLEQGFKEKIEKENEYRIEHKIDEVDVQEDAIPETNTRIINILNRIILVEYKNKLENALNVYEHIKERILTLLEEEIKN